MMKWLTAILGMLSAALYAIMQKRRADSAEASREYERAGSEAMVSGLKKEQEARNEVIDTSNRDHFE